MLRMFGETVKCLRCFKMNGMLTSLQEMNAKYKQIKSKRVGKIGYFDVNFVKTELDF